MPMSMSISKKNFIIWIVIIVVTFLSVTIGRRLIGFGGVGVGVGVEVGSSFISTLGSLIVMGVGLGSFYMLKKK